MANFGNLSIDWLASECETVFKWSHPSCHQKYPNAMIKKIKLSLKMS